VEATANIMEFIIDNEIPGDLTIDSDAQVVIELGTQEQALGKSGHLEL
jgi:hypothetical protein